MNVFVFKSKTIGSEKSKQDENVLLGALKGGPFGDIKKITQCRKK